MDFESADSDSDIDDVRYPTFNVNSDHFTNWNNVYSGLTRMSKLKQIWLKSHYTDCSDLCDILMKIATINTVEHLTIQVSTLEHDPIQMNDFQKSFSKYFTSLKSIRIISASKDTQPFLCHFIQKLPNMKKCILDNDKIDQSVQDTIVTLVEASNGLETLGLKMPAMNFDHLLYIKLIGIKYCKSNQSNNATKPLNIYMNSEPQEKKCITALKHQYDEKIIAIKIKSFMTWEKDPL